MRSQNTINELVKTVLAYSLQYPIFLTYEQVDTDSLDFDKKELVNAFFNASIDNSVLNPLNVVQNIRGNRDVFQEQVLLSNVTAYFKSIQDMRVTEKDAKDAVKQLSDEGASARVINALKDSLEYAQSCDKLEETLAFVEGTFTVASQAIDSSTECSLGEAGARVWQDYLDAESGKGPKPIRTGLKVIDETIMGLYPNEMTVIAGISGSGKTQLSQQILFNVAESGERVFFISMEMSDKQVAQRYLSTKLMVDINEIRAGKLKPNDRVDAIRLLNQFAKLPFHIEYGQNLTFNQIKIRIMRMIRKYGKPKLIAIDYFQQIKYFGHNENSGLGEVSIQINALSKELDTHIILVAQMTKDIQRRVDKNPVLADLRGTSQIGNDATNVWFTYNEYEDDKTKVELKGTTKVLQRKSRYGVSGSDWEFGWNHGSFRDYVPSMRDRMTTARLEMKKEEQEECPFDV
jgi:replicative DNA helicase